jgi:hypothetical protein
MSRFSRLNFGFLPRRQMNAASVEEACFRGLGALLLGSVKMIAGGCFQRPAGSLPQA